MSSPVNKSPVAAALALLDGHREHTVTVTATQARHDFFPLLQGVVSDPAEVVEVEHKALSGRVLLVHERFRDYVRDLEQVVRALVAVAPGDTMEEGAFQLAGSLAVTGDVEEAIMSLRDRDRQVTAARFDAL